MATSGERFGFLVSDLVPKSTLVSRFQELSELRVGIQQQLRALAHVKQHTVNTVYTSHTLTDALQV